MQRVGYESGNGSDSGNDNGQHELSDGCFFLMAPRKQEFFRITGNLNNLAFFTSIKQANDYWFLSNEWSWSALREKHLKLKINISYVIYQTLDSVPSHIKNWEECWKFLSNFEVFDIVMKHSDECLT